MKNTFSYFLMFFLLITGAKSILGQRSSWFNYAIDLNNAKGQTLPYYFDYLFPDSTVQMLWDGLDNKLHYVQAHSCGQVLDPISQIFSNPLTTNDAYHVDSVGCRYKYFRYQHAVGDTLVVQLFKHDKIIFHHISGTKDTPYAYVLYDTLLRRSPLPTYEYKYVLTDKDAITANYGFLTIPVVPPITVLASQKIAATFTYYPGNTYHTGDTIYNNTIPSKPINGFRVRYYEDVSRTFEEGIYNNGIAVWNEERYGFANGWNGKYHSENVWYAGSRHLDMGFKITSLKTGVKEEHLSTGAFSVFPNPLHAGSDYSLIIDLKKPMQININIFDAQGKSIAVFNEDGINTGKNLLTIKNNFVDPGIYFIKVQGEYFSNVKRILVE